MGSAQGKHITNRDHAIVTATFITNWNCRIPPLHVKLISYCIIIYNFKIAALAHRKRRRRESTSARELWNVKKRLSLLAKYNRSKVKKVQLLHINFLLWEIFIFFFLSLSLFFTFNRRSLLAMSNIITSLHYLNMLPINIFIASHRRRAISRSA